MTTLPSMRASLASLVCPLAPFLAPRLLRTYAPLAALPPRWLLPMPGRRHKTSESFRKIRSQTRRQQIFDENATVLERMRHACTQRNLQALMELYPSVVLTGALTREDSRRMAQALHHCMRTASDSSTLIQVLPFVEQMVNDLKNGTLPPHPYAFVHLIGIHKETNGLRDAGHSLWQWLVQQDDSYLSPAVYGAAIEFLSYTSKVHLHELESLYVDALKRFPGTFAEYHLSPNAILSDRRRRVFIPQVSVALLQGILTARLRSGDWKNAYLALDTGLRLFPTQLPMRFFELFNGNRPLAEAYTVYMIAYRAGIVLKPGHLTNMISAIKKAMLESNSLGDRVTLLRAVANAIYANLEAGGHLAPIHVAQLIDSFGLLLPELPRGTDYREQQAVLRNHIVTFAHGVLSSFFQAGMPPSSEPFLALVRLAGRLRVPDLLRVSLQDMETAQVNINQYGIRAILTSAGHAGSTDILQEYWTRIAHAAESSGSQIEGTDWLCLIKACKRAECPEYCREQLSQLEHAIPAGLQDKLHGILATEGPDTVPAVFEIVSPDALQSELAKLDTQIKNISAVVMSGQRLDIRNTPFYMSLDPQTPPMASPEEMRVVYNEYTIDPHQPPSADPTVQAVVSPTGIPLDELRFANWVSIVELMDQAQAYEEKCKRLSQLTGSPELPASEKSPLKRHTITLPLYALRGYIKRLRDPAEPRKNPSSTSQDAFRTIFVDSRREREGNKLRIIHHQSHQAGKHAWHLKLNLPPTQEMSSGEEQAESVVRESEAPCLTRKPLTTETKSEVSILYHMFPSGTQLIAAPPEGAKPPALRYYVGLQSDHAAPVPAKLSRRPLGNRKYPGHHLFRGRVAEDMEGNTASEMGNRGEQGADEDLAKTGAESVMGNGTA